MLFLSGANQNSFSNFTAMAKSSILDFEKDLSLSQFTFENLQEGIFWVNSNGNILNVNNAACAMTGYSKKELQKMRVQDINPSEIVVNFPEFWQKLKKEKKFRFEAKHKHKTGYLYDVEITGNFIEYNGEEFACSIVRDTRKRKLEEELLRTIAEATSGFTGYDYFTELTKFIANTLNVRYSMVVACSGDEVTKLRMLSYVERQEVLENIEYDTKGTPCEIVMEGKEFFCAN